MSEPSTINTPEFRHAFLENERQERIQTGKTASALVFFLMPLGSLMDALIYSEQLWYFLEGRLVCSLLAALLWYLHTTSFGYRHYRWLGVPIALLPATFMCWIIATAIGTGSGAMSHYYAALNLILLAISVVVRWGVGESMLCSTLIIGMYLLACVPHWAQPNPREFWNNLCNNLYFISLTGVIVVTGNYLFQKLRFREFVLRYELDKNKRQLEAQNTALATANRQIKEAEAELVQSEKLASLGRMSAGIIHEINNPLNFAKTGLYTLKNKGKHLAPEQRAEYLDIVKDVEDGFNRVSSIVSSLRGFTHHDDEIHEDIPVADLVESSLRFVSHEWSDTIKLQKFILGGQTIHANKNKLIQVCLNLLENSLDALKTKTFPPGETPVITITSHVENNFSQLTFHDNGPGIAPENLGKIFDPFFTTKDVGSGMGMGLSICHRIVQSYGGEIRVKTEPGKYCEFTLEFPLKQ